MKTFVIAEAGSNHNRDWELAKKLVDAAVYSKSNAVKFQTYSSETLYSKNTPNFAGYENINQLIKDIELPRRWQKDLKMYCDDTGIEFMSTPFDEKAVDELYSIGVKRFKIAGFECTDPRFVKYVASTGLPLIISLGIGTSIETMFQIQRWVLDIDDILDVHLGTYNFSNTQHVTYLHCNNAYPTPFQDINLGTMKEMVRYSKNHKWFKNTQFGLSDHTEGILIPPVAVAMGAQVIEKHFTLDRKMPGPDHPFAIEPNELKKMVENIRIAEVVSGKKSTKYTESEKSFSKARRSVVAKRDIKKGEMLTNENITTKRPFLEDCIPALHYFKVIGSIAKRDIGDDELLLTGDI